jgi:hypothetical protein
MPGFPSPAEERNPGRLPKAAWRFFLVGYAVRSVPQRSVILRRPGDPYCGGNEPRYEAIAMTSSSDRLATTGFINAAASPALEPYCISKSCRAT